MFYYGVVEDRNDPEFLGRVRVRVHGLHTHEKAMIPTEKLPWAQVMTPTTSSSFSGVGETPKLIEGTFVVLNFIDGENMQMPIVIGTVPGITQEHILEIDGTPLPRGSGSQGFQDPNNMWPEESYLNNSDLPKLARNTIDFEREQHTSENPLFTITEPEDIRSNHVYPYNQVKQSESGHFEEWDDTTGNERLGLQHKSGTFREIRPDGTKVEKIVGASYKIVADSENVYIEGKVNLHINSTCNTYINGDWNVRVTGNQNITVDGNITEIVGGNVDQDVAGAYDQDVVGTIRQDARQIWLNDGDASAAPMAARVGDTADTGDAGTGSHFDTNSAGSDEIETGSRTVFIGD